MVNSFKIVTFGCKVNTHESEGIKEFLKNKGLVESDNSPDYIIINSCAVTSTAERKCRYKLHSLIKKFPNAKVLIMGCSAANSFEEYKKIANVKVISGNEGKINAVKVLLDNRKEQINLVNKNSRNFLYDEENHISQFGKECRAFLKIQDGCNNFCSYCIIPYVRGNSRSRKKESVLSEVASLFENGYKEIVITGIDMGSYSDLEGKYFLKDLLKDILDITPEGRRIRISSLETGQIDDDIIDLFSIYKDKLVRHLHIPLQSGSDKILKLMNRKYDLDKFRYVCNELKKKINGFGFSTDVIVGFPQESNDDFLNTYEFIKEIGFSRLHVFPYSKREGTYAYNLKQINDKEKKSRVARLIELGNILKEKFISELENERISVLFEKTCVIDGKKHFYGYSDNYLEVDVISEKDLLNSIYSVSIINGKFVLNS